MAAEEPPDSADDFVLRDGSKAKTPKNLEARLTEIDGMVVWESMFGNGDAYWCNATKIAHVDHDGNDPQASVRIQD